MGKKNKNKTKKVNPKKEKYAKFRKEKPATMTYTAPDATPEMQEQRKEDEKTMSLFMRHTPRIPRREILERRIKSKR